MIKLRKVTPNDFGRFPKHSVSDTKRTDGTVLSDGTEHKRIDMTVRRMA